VTVLVNEILTLPRNKQISRRCRFTPKSRIKST
jgi:hypothetical protein